MSYAYFLFPLSILTNIISGAAIVIYPIVITGEIDKIHFPNWVVEQGTNKSYLIAVFLAALLCGPFVSWWLSLAVKRHIKIILWFIQIMEWMYFAFGVMGALLAIKWTQTGTLIAVTSAIEERLTGKVVSRLDHLEKSEKKEDCDSSLIWRINQLENRLEKAEKTNENLTVRINELNELEEQNYGQEYQPEINYLNYHHPDVQLNTNFNYPSSSFATSSQPIINSNIYNRSDPSIEMYYLPQQNQNHQE